ncbi:hypothetical protein [Streptomyces hayashii]|uniref:hypothetical protein n=1 Tax=Streptomyces hayashii TaxID=2839966 RepID=UPI00403C7473
MVFLANDLLIDLAEPQRPAIFEAMAQAPDGSIPAARTLRRVVARENSDGPDRTWAAARPGRIREARSLIGLEALYSHLRPDLDAPTADLDSPQGEHRTGMPRHTLELLNSQAAARLTRQSDSLAKIGVAPALCAAAVRQALDA